MIQALIIQGEEVRYSIDAENITAVLGYSYIYTNITYTDALRVVYLGLQRKCGLSADEFVAAALKGQVFASARRGHVPLSLARMRVVARVRSLNKQFVTRRDLKP